MEEFFPPWIALQMRDYNLSEKLEMSLKSSEGIRHLMSALVLSLGK